MRRLLALTAFLLAASAPSAPAGTSVGHSGWEWSNPLPQGNTVRALAFSGMWGYAGGEFGTLLRSGDGGLSWMGLPTGVIDDVTEVAAIDADSVVFAAECAVRRSDDAGATFRRLAWTASDSRCRVPVAAIAFPAQAEAGYLLLEDGRVMRTGDGGTSWNRMVDVPGSLAAGGRSRAVALAFGGPDAGVATTEDGIYRTADGGVSWSRAQARGRGFHDAVFAGGLTGYAVGPGTIAKTVDGGRTWASLVGTGSLDLGSVRCASALVCIAATRAGDRVLRTSDGGLLWTVASLEPGSAYALAFATAARALAAGGNGAVFGSSDAGATWSALGGSIGDHFTGLAGGRFSRAFATGERGLIAATDDGGATWSQLAPPSEESVVDVSFGSEKTGFALDASGSLHRTEDGGATWRELTADRSARPQALLALDADRLLLVGARGMRRSTDGGLSFEAARRRAVRRAILFGVDEAGDAVVAYGPTTLLVSRDGGRSWKVVRRPDHRPLATVDFVSASVGFALGKGGRTWRTRNGGRTWREVLGTGTDGALEIGLSSARKGYVVARDLFFARGSGGPDYVLRTSDGGATWRPQLVTGHGRVTALLAVPGRADLLLDSDSELFTTDRGGDAGKWTRLRLTARRKLLPRAGRVTLRGRLSRARGGEQLVVSKTNVDRRSRRGANDWDFKSVRVRSNGRFTVRWRVRRTTAFVAQWPGDGARMGAGSKVVTVRVKKR